MHHKWTALRVFILLGTLVVLGLLVKTDVPAQSVSEPRLKHNVCSAQCVLDQNILRSGMGDTQAKRAFDGWYDTYYGLTGCSQSGIRTIAEFTLSVIGELAGSPGGYTMQCWQGLMAQSHLCSDDCSDYFISNAKYGPNVDVDLDSGFPGSLSVTMSNNDRGYLPEETPNGYSLQFYLKTTLQLDDGTELLVDNTLMPSMSYSNWITRGGWDDCVREDGEDDERCQIIAAFDMPNVIPADVDFYNGVLYDLSDHISDSDGSGGSFSDNGFIELFSDGDSITIEEGPYSGFYWTKVHGSSDIITPWDATYGSVFIKNHECNTFWCDIVGDRVNADTYVFALQGPEELRLSGTYTVKVTADLLHDKDFSNNVVSYSYTELDIGDTQDTGSGDEEEDQSIPLEDLAVIDLPGPGEYPGTLPDDMPGVMYRLVVPDELHFLFIRIVSLDGGQYSAFIERGGIPVPNYPYIYQAYDGMAEGNASFSNGCPFQNPTPDSYYIFVPFSSSGSEFQLEVEWMTQSEAATTVAMHEATQQAFEEEQTPTYTEIEPNDTHETANVWEMQEPFTGRLATFGDVDYVLMSFDYSGIYTFTLSDVSPASQAVLMLVRAPAGGFLASVSEKGEPLSLTFDASAGEQYFFKISSYKLDEGGSDYQLEMTSFISDPDESNDDRQSATFWDITQGAIQGYFWDKIGRSDYYKFIAQPTQDNTPTTFSVSNPGADIRVCLKLLKFNGAYLESTPCSSAGEPTSLTYSLEAGQEYYLKLYPLNVKTSSQPYTLSVDYQPAGTADDVEDQSQEYTISGFVYRHLVWLHFGIKDAEVYIQVSGQPAFLLDTTNIFGRYNVKMDLIEGDEVYVWVVKEGMTFLPEEDIFYIDPDEDTYHSVFVMAGGELIQETSTPEPETTGTEPPPPVQTGLAVTITPELKIETLTSLSTPSPTATPSPTPTTELQSSSTTTIFTGTVWRLFAESDPAGIAGAEVILSVNGVDQATTYSMVDGAYLISITGISPGDTLSLRAQATEDVFEPLNYEWQAEAGVDKWDHEFYSYWDEITPPDQDDQNRIYGWVLDGSGHGVPGVYLTLQMGNSDALQRLGPTDANGFYDGMVRLPSRIMVTVWVDAEGYLPSQIQFFHAYYFENREINFRQEAVERQ